MRDQKSLIEARKDLPSLANKRGTDLSRAPEAAGSDERRRLATLAMTPEIDAQLALNLQFPLPVHE
jgi:hypothetical protein